MGIHINKPNQDFVYLSKSPQVPKNHLLPSIAVVQEHSLSLFYSVLQNSNTQFQWGVQVFHQTLAIVIGIRLDNVVI